MIHRYCNFARFGYGFYVQCAKEMLMAEHRLRAKKYELLQV